MVDVKKAVASAMTYVTELMASAGADYRLEEVSLSDDERLWLVTVGFSVLETPDPDPLEAIMPRVGPPAQKRRRVYKTVKVDAESGRAVSMEIRQI